MHVARSASGARMSASRASTPAARHRPVSALAHDAVAAAAGDVRRARQAPHGPNRWLTHRTCDPNSPACSAA